MTEFDLIRRYFTRPSPGALLGVGDDAALLRVSDGNVLVVSTDMLVSGTHFFPDADPFLLGHKTLAVNLSDMAAMGALPRWATLAITLPEADEVWLERFSAGFFALAQQHGVELVGGDTTRGPLNLCVTIMGEVPKGTALLRSGAQAGDEVWVSGQLGDAALALAHLQGNTVLPEAELAVCARALHQPQPRVALGLALRGVASSAIDISDGLLADLGHILDASKVGAQIDLMKLPVSLPVSENYGRSLGIQCALAGGDDYELCFSAPVMRHAEIMNIGARLGLPLTCIGEIVAGQGCIVRDAAGKPLKLGSRGYDHFR
jgi:thiamine-monophosphate kinase